MNSNDSTVAIALQERHYSIDRHCSKQVDRHCSSVTVAEHCSSKKQFCFISYLLLTVSVLFMIGKRKKIQGRRVDIPEAIYDNMPLSADRASRVSIDRHLTVSIDDHHQRSAYRPMRPARYRSTALRIQRLIVSSLCRMIALAINR